ncbi:hypothetical protein CNR22_21780 [Sphingobacteriaceae bacterium]|nr:hypothetical protein CNR22_21780 [Sphingobacteriaceae bacterium]
MLKKLLLLSFVEGAAVMAAELCGAKLLAPVFGSSLYVWASVMGITLAALASGYFFGGRVSEKKNNHSLNLFRLLSAAAMFLLIMPVISYYLVPRISYLPFLTGVVASTLALLFPPIFFLGASSPLFILVQTSENEKAGKVSGTVYAVSTLGGIFATFLCGFYFIPEFGLNTCLLAFGAVLFVMNVFVFRVFKGLHFFLAISFAYLNLQFTEKKKDFLLSSDSILGYLQVRDLMDGRKKPYRILTINDIIQSEMDLQSKRSLSKYVTLIDTLLKNISVKQNALVLGLGGGLTANLLVKKNYRTEGVELDARITKAARDFFYLDETVKTYDEDARYFLNHCDKKYQVILVDIFKGEEQPSHVLTLESLKKLKQNITDSSVILINWHGYTSDAKGLGTAILNNTLQRAGYKVKLCSYSLNEAYRNILFVASLKELGILPYELNEKLQEVTLCNTDNAPLLEKYNAKANKAWRLNYLRYYQGN